MSAVAMVLLVTVCVDPPKCAMPKPGEDATTQVVQVNVPVVVIVPPPKGPVVAIEVTVPSVRYAVMSNAAGTIALPKGCHAKTYVCPVVVGLAMNVLVFAALW
jgi:hypothetical protein